MNASHHFKHYNLSICAVKAYEITFNMDLKEVIIQSYTFNIRKQKQKIILKLIPYKSKLITKPTCINDEKQHRSRLLN